MDVIGISVGGLCALLRAGLLGPLTPEEGTWLLVAMVAVTMLLLGPSMRSVVCGAALAVASWWLGAARQDWLLVVLACLVLGRGRWVLGPVDGRLLAVAIFPGIVEPLHDAVLTWWPTNWIEKGWPSPSEVGIEQAALLCIGVVGRDWRTLGIWGGLMLVNAAALWCVKTWGWLEPSNQIICASAAVLGTSIAATCRQARHVVGRNSGIYFLITFATVMVVTLSNCSWSAEARPSVGWWNEGGLDWDRASKGKYGAFVSGMFGQLPLMLETTGARCTVMEPPNDEEALRSALHGLDKLVCINPSRRWSLNEREAIAAWVHGGGDLLVLVDHTNVFGCADSCNALLAGLGITVRNDAAYPLRHSMVGCVRLADGLVTCDRQMGGLGHAIGASLVTGPEWHAMVTLLYGFRDQGCPENVPGAGLGNYLREPGEASGDVVIVAERWFGSGHIVVYGDTSAFQNSALASTWACHVRKALTAPHPEWGRLRWWLLLAGLAGLARAARVTPRSTAALILVTALARGGLLGVLGGAVGEVPIVAAFANGYVAQTGHYEEHYNSVGPLYLALERAGAVPRTDLSPRECRAVAQSVAIIAPMVAPDKRDCMAWRSWVAEGGRLLIVGSREDGAGAEDLLRAFGAGWSEKLVVEEFREEDRFRPQFVVASPMRLDEPNAWTVMASASTGPLICWRNYGKGRVMAVADGRFFAEQNVEGLWGHRPGNVWMVERIVEEWTGRSALVTVPTYRNPKKPG